MVATVVTGLAPVAARADNAAVKRELTALFVKFSIAFKKKDVKTALSFFSSDYIATESGKKITRAQVESQMTLALANLKSVDTLTWDIEKISVKGGQATTEALETLSATVVDTVGTLGKKGETHRLKDVERTRDVFVKTPKGWLLKRSDTLFANISIDGRKFVPPASPAK